MMQHSKEVLDLHLDMIENERNIYELATLFEQKRKNISDYLNELKCPITGATDLELHPSQIKISENEKSYSVRNNVVDFRPITKDKTEWDDLNQQFLNYHRSLSVYTLVNAMPLFNYLSLKTGLGEVKDKKVLDVGGGTGHAYCTFFRHPESISYYLLDPNLRLLHDQLIRFYPELSYLPIAHLLGFAENLPFIDNNFDIVMSISSIDHFKDYKQFIKEAYRVLKPGGILLISSHLDIDYTPSQVSVGEKVFSSTLLERLSRYIYFRKHRVGGDDHTYHFADTSDFEREMISAHFNIKSSEIYKRYFYVIGEKIS